jgi:hypothetical protein
MWCKTDQEQLDVFRKEFPGMDFEAALQHSTPRDIWICSTNKMGAQVQDHLISHHRKNFPGELAMVRFDPDKSIAHKYKKQGQAVHVPGTNETVAAYKGTLVSVPLNIVLQGLPLEWKYAGWGTVHRVQGKTIPVPSRIYIIDHSLEGWITNAVYTAVSRARLANQLVRVLPHNEAEKPLVPSDIQATPSEGLILARLKRYAIEDRQKKRPEIHKNDKLTIPYILEQIEDAGKKCTVCGVNLLLQQYTNGHPQTFSIDRLNDDLGHQVGNVRITCLRCNIRHRR